MKQNDTTQPISGNSLKGFFVHTPYFKSSKNGIGNDSRQLILMLEKLGYGAIAGKIESKFILKILSLMQVRMQSKRASFNFIPQISPPIYRGRKLVRCHDVFPISNPEWFKFLSIWNFKTGLVLLRNSIFIVNSRYTKSELLKIYPKLKDSIYVVYCQVRNFHTVKKCSSCHVCNQLDIFPEKKIVIAVGTLEPRKNYVNLLQAWEISNLSKSSFILVIVGKKGWKYRKILQQYQKATSGVFLIDDACDYALATLYKKSLILISNSISEGFNLPVAEALSFGKKVLISDIPVHRELYGQYANFFPLQSADKLAQFLSSNLEYLCDENREIKFNSLEDQSGKNLSRALEVLLS